MNRFIDDTKVKKKNLQNVLNKAQALKNKAQAKIESLPLEQRQQLVEHVDLQEASKQVQQRMQEDFITNQINNLPKIDKDILITEDNMAELMQQFNAEANKVNPGLVTIDQNIEPEEKPKRRGRSTKKEAAEKLAIHNRRVGIVDEAPRPILNQTNINAKVHSDANLYHQLQKQIAVSNEIDDNDIRPITAGLKEDYELYPYEINESPSAHVLQVNRENGKIRAETRQARELNQKEEPNMLDKELLLNKQNEVHKEIKDLKLELEITARMQLVVDDKLKTSYQTKVKSIQDKIKEKELRLSIITNIMNGR